MSEPSILDRLQNKPWWQICTLIGVFWISLGSASEAFILIRDGYVYVYSSLSNDYDYEALDSVNVGNTSAYIEDTFGQPRVSRAIDENTTANYFYNDKYLLTLFYTEGRVAAYTWLSLDDGFTPLVDLRSGETSETGSFVYSDLMQSATDYTLDDSRIVRFYLEALEGSRAAGFLGTYLGSVEYGAFAQPEDVTALYQAEVMGSDSEIAAARQALRESSVPNLYGEGNLPLALIERSILSNAEFTNFFGRN